MHRFAWIAALLIAAAAAIAPARAQIPGTANIQVGGTNIIGGTNGRCLYDNAGKVGETASCGLAGGITVGTSVITGGTTTRVLFDNAGLLGEYAISGTGSVCMTTSCAMTSPTISGSFTATGLVANASLANMANSTVKCRTTAGTGVPEDCTAAQTAAIVGSVGGALKSKLITGLTRDLTAASGSVGYTGFGFTPTTCFANGAVAASNTQYFTVFGMADSARAGRSTYLATNQNIGTSFIVAADPTVANFQIADVASYDIDGLTLGWTKTGAPSGTFTFSIMCYR